MPTTQIKRELCAQYSQITDLTLAKGEVVGNDMEAQKRVIAIVKAEKRLSKTDLEKIQRWLSVRLEIENVEIFQQ